MTIPFTLPFGRRRLVLSLDLLPASAAMPHGRTVWTGRRAPDVPGAFDATDAELARLNGRASAAQDRLRWEAQAVFCGLRPY